MTLQDFVIEALEQCRSACDRAINELYQDEWYWRPNPEANSIAFVVWHVSRVEDRWTQPFAQGIDELWESQGWGSKLGLPGDTGLGWTEDQVTEMPRVNPDDLKGYFDAVRQSTLDYVRNLSPEGFEVVPGGTPFPEFARSLDSSEDTPSPRCVARSWPRRTSTWAT